MTPLRIGQGYDVHVFEAGDHVTRIHSQLDDLECDLALDWRLLFGEVNEPATTFTNLPKQPVVANRVSSTFHGGHFKRPWSQDWFGEELVRCRTGSQ